MFKRLLKLLFGKENNADRILRVDNFDFTVLIDLHSVDGVDANIDSVHLFMRSGETYTVHNATEENKKTILDMFRKVKNGRV